MAIKTNGVDTNVLNLLNGKVDTSEITATAAANKIPRLDSEGKLPSGTYMLSSKAKYIKITDTKPSSTNGGTFTSGAWRTRDLNTIDTDDTEEVSLSSNEFTLPAGTYILKAFVPAYKVNYHKAKLYDITNSTDKLIGTSANTDNNTYVVTNSIIAGKFTITSSTIFEIRHYCITTRSSDGFGQGYTPGITSEVYTTVELWKVA